MHRSSSFSVDVVLPRRKSAFSSLSKQRRYEGREIYLTLHVPHVSIWSLVCTTMLYDRMCMSKIYVRHMHDASRSQSTSIVAIELAALALLGVVLVDAHDPSRIQLRPSAASCSTGMVDWVLFSICRRRSSTLLRTINTARWHLCRRRRW